MLSPTGAHLNIEQDLFGEQQHLAVSINISQSNIDATNKKDDRSQRRGEEEAGEHGRNYILGHLNSLVLARLHPI